MAVVVGGREQTGDDTEDGSWGEPSSEMGSVYEAILPPVLGMVGYLAGWNLPRAGATGSPLSSAFVAHPQYMVWRVVIAAQLALWLALLPHAWAWRKQMHKRCELVPSVPGWVQVVATLLFVGTILVPLGLIRSETRSPLLHASERMWILYVIGFIVATIVILGFTSVYVALRSPHWNQKKSAQHFLEDLRFLGSYKRRFLALAGAIISAAVVSTAVLNNATNAFYRDVSPALLSGPRPAPAAPGLVLGLGALFVAVLALVYLPCQVHSRERGERLLNTCMKLRIDDADVAGTIERRNLLRDELDLRRSARQTLTDTVVIFAPLLSGALAFLVTPG